LDGPSDGDGGSPDDAVASDLGTDETAGSSARTAETDTDTDTAADDDESA
jgi:hypothetical protein